MADCGQPDDAPTFDQVAMLAQEELPALGRRGSVEDHHAQAGHQANQVPEGLNASDQLRGGRVAVDVPRVRGKPEARRPGTARRGRGVA